MRNYYTISEAAKRLGCPKSDLYHYLETSQIEASLYASQRKFIVTTYNETLDQWEGQGTVSYRGLIQTHESWVKALLEDKEITLNAHVSLLSPEEVSNYSIDCPFHSLELPSPLKAWNLDSLNEVPKSAIFYPLPRQAPSLAGTLSMLSKNLTKAFPAKTQDARDYQEKILNQPEVSQFQFDYGENGTFLLDDIRLTQETFETLQALRNAQDITESKSPELPWSASKARSTRIDRLIERAYLDNKNGSTNEIWEAIKVDCEGESVYDTEEVIDQIDELSIEWTSQRGKPKSLLRRSFDNKISKIRQFHLIK